MDMIMAQYITPEEKLLKLIRKKSPAALKAESVSRGQVPLSKDIHHEKDFLKLFNFVLVMVSLLLISFLIYNTITHQQLLVIKPIKTNEKEEKNASVSEPFASPIKPFSFYQKEISGRNFFQFPWEKPKPAAAPVKDVAQELRQQLKVIGILLDQEPKVIVEDLRTQQTLFISRGERIGEAVLESVEEGKAVFVYNGERIELTP